MPLITLYKLDPARTMPIEHLCLDSSYVNPLLSFLSYNFKRIVDEVLPQVDLAKVVDLVQRLYLLDNHGPWGHRVLTLSEISIKLTPVVEDKIID